MNEMCRLRGNPMERRGIVGIGAVTTSAIIRYARLERASPAAFRAGCVVTQVVGRSG